MGRAPPEYPASSTGSSGRENAGEMSVRRATSAYILALSLVAAGLVSVATGALAAPGAVSRLAVLGTALLFCGAATALCVLALLQRRCRQWAHKFKAQPDSNFAIPA